MIGWDGARTLAARLGLTSTALAVALGLLVVQTVRIEGLHVWPISVTGWKARALDAERTIADIEKAQDEALAAAVVARDQAEADYRNLAERIDRNAEDARQDAMADAERYIAAHRVRCPAIGGPAGGTAPAAEGHRARDGEDTGAATELDAAGLVAVSEEDIRICTVNTMRAEAGRAWALEMEASR